MKNNKLSIGLIVAICIIVFIVVSTIIINIFILDTFTDTSKSIYKYRTTYSKNLDKSSKIAQIFELKDGLLYKNKIMEKIDDSKSRLVIIYDNTNNIKELTEINKEYFIKYSFIAFSLIQDLDEITISSIKDNNTYKIESIQRNFAISILGFDPYIKTETLEDFESFKHSLDEVDYKNIALPVNNLDKAISLAINDYYKPKFYQGEFSTSAHVNIAVYEDNSTTTVYTYSDYMSFQFQNGIFEQCSRVKMPLKLIFEKDIYKNYTLSKIQAPNDNYNESLQNLFSTDLIAKLDIIKSDKTQLKIIEDDISQTLKKYLLSIGRENSKISYSYQEKIYPSINKKNADTYDIIYKSYSDFPYYIGTLEKIENNVRYEYSTKHEKQKDSDIITYTKKDIASDNVIESIKLQISDKKLTVLEGQLRDSFKDFEKQYNKDQDSAKDYKN